MLKISSTWINAGMDTSGRGLLYAFKGSLGWLRHQKCAGESSLHCQLELSTLEVLVYHRQKSAVLWSTRFSAVPRKQFADRYWFELCSLVWCGKLAAVVVPSILDTPWGIVFTNKVFNQILNEKINKFTLRGQHNLNVFVYSFAYYSVFVY